MHASLWAAVSGLPACGYHAVYGGPTNDRFTVTSGQLLVPDTVAAQAALSGARAEFAAAGRLAETSAYPHVVVDVLRVDELSRGIHVENGAPHAGGMSIGVTVRARLIPQPQQEPSSDSGDVRRAAAIAGYADPRADYAAYELALRAAAERAGKAAARILLGIPEPSDESP